MLNEFADRFWKVSEESLGRDETQRQTYHELFHKYLSHLSKIIGFKYSNNRVNMNDQFVDG